MRGVAETVREAGLEPWSAAGTVERQTWMADMADAGVFAGGDAAGVGWRYQADRVLGAVKAARKAPLKTRARG